VGRTECYPQVGVGVVVFDEEGRILLVRRGGSPGRGLWSLPGGRVEPGESIFSAAVRELEEETGISSEPVAVIDVNELMVYDASGRLAYHYVLVDVLVKSKSLEVKPGSDALEAGFFSLEEALSKGDLSESTRAFLNKLKGSGTCNIVPATTVRVE